LKKLHQTLFGFDSDHSDPDRFFKVSDARSTTLYHY